MRSKDDNRGNRDEVLARAANAGKRLYCTECCTYFIQDSNGDWVKSHTDGKLKADLVADSFLECTCGGKLAVKLPHIGLKGEFFPLH